MYVILGEGDQGRPRPLWINCELRHQAPVPWASMPHSFPHHPELLNCLPHWLGSKGAETHVTHSACYPPTPSWGLAHSRCSINTEWQYTHQLGSSQEGQALPATPYPSQCWTEVWAGEKGSKRLGHLADIRKLGQGYGGLWAWGAVTATVPKTGRKEMLASKWSS